AVYNSDGKPSFLAEFKAPEIQLGNDTILQISQYASKLKVPQLCISNGLKHICFKWNGNEYQHIELSELQL
ncbi:MAG: type I restriction enzyme HsdR N-terminal domain-containing protein, partial [Bacteroidetes bacterium]|nr:type I restriction enzyme HsdR N-terminal domain-containing protein [Bacteroidota bacterium]